MKAIDEKWIDSQIEQLQQLKLRPEFSEHDAQVPN